MKTYEKLEIFNEVSLGWVSLILYRRWTGSYAVACFDRQRDVFAGVVYAFPDGIRAAHRFFAAKAVELAA